MGLSLWSLVTPTPGVDGADNGVSALVDMDVFHSHFLLAFAAAAVECIEKKGIGAGELVRLGQVFAVRFEGLLGDHSAPVAFHGGIV
jgi:hypothetical protein